MSHTPCNPAEDLTINCVGEPTDNTLLDNTGVRSDAAVVDDPAADALCGGGTWVIPQPPANPDFPINESFENTTMDTGDANWQLQGLAQLTAGPPINDGNGNGRLRLSNAGAFTNGAAVYEPTFSNTDNTTTEVSWASYGGTNPGGDGWMQFYSDGSQPVQDNALGGGGSLGLGNVDYGYVIIVLDEFGGSGPPGGFNFNRLKIRCGCVGNDAPPSCAGAQLASIPLAPETVNQHPRNDEPRLRTSIVTEAGQTFLSVSILWPGDVSYTVYLDRFNITGSCGVAPASLRTGFSASSGGAYQSIKEFHDLSIQQGGLQHWRALQVSNDTAVEDCSGAQLAADRRVVVTATVDHTFDSSSAPNTGTNNEAWLWIVDSTDNSGPLATDQKATSGGNIGVTTQMSTSFTVTQADLPNIRVYLGDDRRDVDGFYAQTWENLVLTAEAEACNCPTCEPATAIMTDSAILNATADFVPTDRFIRVCWGTVQGGPYPNCELAQVGSNTDQQMFAFPIVGLAPNTDYYYIAQLLDTDGTTVLDASDECTFSTGDVPSNMQFLPQVSDPDAECVDPGNITEDSATVEAQAENVPPQNTLWLALSETPGGPYTFQEGPPGGEPGQGVGPQQFQHTFTGLEGNTGYWVVIQERDDEGEVVEQSEECCFHTYPSSDPIDNECIETGRYSCYSGGSGVAQEMRCNVTCDCDCLPGDYTWDGEDGIMSPDRTTATYTLVNGGTELQFQITVDPPQLMSAGVGFQCSGQTSFSPVIYGGISGNPNDTGPSRLRIDLTQFTSAGGQCLEDFGPFRWGLNDVDKNENVVLDPIPDRVITVSSVGGAFLVLTDNLDGTGTVTVGGPGPTNSNCFGYAEWDNPPDEITHFFTGACYTTEPARDIPTIENATCAETVPQNLWFDEETGAPVQEDELTACVQCDPATDIGFDGATLNGQTLTGFNGDYSLRFQYGTVSGGPYTHLTGGVPVDGSNPQVFSETILGTLEPNTTYYYVAVLYDLDEGHILEISDECQFTTAPAVAWCGYHSTANNCLIVDPGNGFPYFNCNPV